MFNKKILKELIIAQTESLQDSDLGISREKINSIKSFFNLPHAIIIAGIRRVGKSTLLRQIMKNFYKENCYYFSLENEQLINFKSTDFNTLYEILLELFGEKKVFFLDEIQSIQGWENFVRRMQDSKFKFFITGSNASLLSKELGTKLTGRHISLVLYPFSFKEYLLLNKFEFKKEMIFKIKERAKIQKFFYQYLKDGGMPEYLKYKNIEIFKMVYEDILYRDIVARYEIKEIKALRELALYYISNLGSYISFNKLKDLLKIGSVNTIKSYSDYLENSFLFFFTNHFSYSLKQQYIAPKKVYCIDNGLASSIAFSFSENKGKFLENLVFIELKRRGEDIFYYKTKNNLEIDFLTVIGKKPDKLIQVCWDISEDNTKKREINALVSASKELKIKSGIILTTDNEDEIKVERIKIKIIPVWKWLLLNN